MLVCERCGRENAVDARFCSSCGAALTAALAFYRGVGASAMVREAETLLPATG